MKIDCFNYIKENVNIIKAAEFYGITVNRHNKALCPFHPDRNPSLSFKGNFFKCFVCDTKGDVISLVLNLLHLKKPIAAARRINADFNLGLNLDEKDSYSIYIAEEDLHLDLREVRKGLLVWCEQKSIEFEKNVEDCMEYLKNMDIPETDEELETRTTEAINRINQLQKYINILNGGSIEDRLKLYRQLRGG